MRQLEGWAATLQQASQLESDRGFADLQGRTGTYSAFILRSLQQLPEALPVDDRDRLQALASSFAAYGSLAEARRRALVVRLRQELHGLCRRHRPDAPPPAPRLKLLPLSQAAGDGSGRGPQAPSTPISPETPLAELPGVGPRTATRLAALGLLLARDLIHHYPRDYLDYAHLVRIAELTPGRTATIVATVRRCHVFRSPRNPNLAILELQLQDSSGRLRVSQFFAGRRFASPAWLHSQQRLYPAGATIAASGLVREGPHGPCFRDPLLEVLQGPGSAVRSEQIGRLVPVYALTEGLTSERLQRAIRSVLPHLDGWGEPLPQALRQSRSLPTRAESLRQLHRPEDRDSLQQARHRLVFDEFLLLQLALGMRRQQWQGRTAPALPPADPDRDLLAAFLDALPFRLTEAQERVLAEIRADMGREQPMARLLQGDVGSGKTVVALAALLVAIQCGCQGALLAPTEVLAEQHARRFAEWLPQLHVSSALLTGSTPPRRRREVLADLINGQLQLLVGTHALLEDPVQFQRLGLVVVDEQHRFGVHQRNRLLAKGLQPHLLTMTATPIPRTLALSIHGDLDLSQIDALPPGRLPVQTRLLRAGERDQAWQLIRQEVARGQRAYVVLPLVEESEKLELRSAVTEHRDLAESVFPDLRVGLLHGRLSSEEKQRAIAAFACGETQVLVSTTVVEVGVDVPEASVMVIDHAERFGLAQLHQLRGRVGRGAAASHCLLIHAGEAAAARQRLEVLVRSHDGFEIAEMDLRLRGPGQVLGTRQSGLPDLALASLADDGEVLEEARQVARDLLARDPSLQRHPGLLQALQEQRRRTLEAARLN
ncbi:MAG: ATP-dependent DNA helicase RecG [Synechococcaceae cyanobacterium]|nr:ATP-dependent DNA helicase RecG [Synechococcaceae cyanobacterium]